MAKAGNFYEIEWEKKPLGFSIVMDTSGKNAYVSSIQDTKNIEKGLRLAAQIVAIQGKSVVDWKHDAILKLIKETKTPPKLKLAFKQRTFANEKEKEAQNEVPEVLKFDGAPKERANRVNGYFELKQKKVNGKHTWHRKDTETDKIVVWWWEKGSATKAGIKGLETGLWMISRESQVNSGNAYACVQSDEDLPTKIGKKWQVFSSEGFVPSAIEIKQAEI